MQLPENPKQQQQQTRKSAREGWGDLCVYHAAIDLSWVRDCGWDWGCQLRVNQIVSEDRWKATNALLSKQTATISLPNYKKIFLKCSTNMQHAPDLTHVSGRGRERGRERERETEGRKGSAVTLLGSPFVACCLATGFTWFRKYPQHFAPH